MDRPEIHYARSGNVYVGYQAFGSGPFDLVVVPGFLSNIDYGWEFESWRNYYGALASIARVLLFDKRGTGISDPVLGAPSLEERMDDVRAVMDAVGSERAALIGSWDGAAIAALFAATYPERTAALILNTPMVRGRWASDYPWGTRDEPDSVASFGADWGTREAIEEAVAQENPGRIGDEQFARQIASYTRLSASPTTFARLLEMNLAIDVREALSTIRVPTLVIHHERPQPRDGEQVDGDELFPNASRRAATLPSGSPAHGSSRCHPVTLLSGPSIRASSLRPLREFLIGAWKAGAWQPAEPDRVLATLLFTDIVGSTERAAELGDARWRDLIQRHHALVRQQLVRFRGREIDTAGDGFFASFDGPARAVRCAHAIVATVPELGLDVRAGLQRVSARSSTENLGASPWSSGRASPPSLSPERCSLRAPSRISWQAPRSCSKSGASTS